MVVIKATLYLLALINPISKIFLLSSMEPPLAGKILIKVSLRATCYAFVILLALTLAGKFLLSVVFHVELYSLKVAGGTILFALGLNAVRHGAFVGYLKQLAGLGIIYFENVVTFKNFLGSKG